MSQLATTGVRIGPWRWHNANSELNSDHIVSHWSDLPLSDDDDDNAEAMQLQVCDDFISRINIIEAKKRLGEGSSGVVYKCAVTLANGDRMQKLVIKLPSRMLQSQILSIHRENGLLLKTLTDKEPAMQESAVRSLKHEFEIFEMLWEPRRFTALLGGGVLGQHLPKHSLRLMQQELKEMKALPGRRHIHEYLHFDPDIPMILTELCDGNLWDLRTHQKALFLGLDHPTSLVMRLGLQIAHAMSYMREQNVVHTDMKLENVFYKRDPHTREIICKVSDFGG